MNRQMLVNRTNYLAIILSLLRLTDDYEINYYPEAISESNYSIVSNTFHGSSDGPEKKPKRKPLIRLTLTDANEKGTGTISFSGRRFLVRGAHNRLYFIGADVDGNIKMQISR